MKTSTIVFNVAAAVFLLALFIGVVDLMSNKTTSYGVTPTPQPGPVLDTRFVTGQLRNQLSDEPIMNTVDFPPDEV